MNELLFFLAIGLGFLILLLLWMRRSAGSFPGRTGLSEAQAALATVQLELPPRALGERIFSPQDLDFISTCTPPEIQHLFLQERKVLALSWLRQTREKVGQIMDFHRKAVRGNIHLNPSVELRLAIDYLLFLLVYDVLCSLVWLRGPFFIPGAVAYATRITDQLSYLSGHILVDLDPRHLTRIKSSWSGGPTAG